MNYELQDNRNILVPKISFTGSLNTTDSVNLGPASVFGFNSIIIESQADLTNQTISVSFSNDQVSWSTNDINTTTTLFSKYSFAVLGKYARITVTNDAISTVGLVIGTYASMNITSSSSGSTGTYRTINDPVQTSDPLLLTKNVVTMKDIGGSMINADSYKPGALNVAGYDASMRQQISEAKIRMSGPTNWNQYYSAGSAPNTVTRNNDQSCTITSTSYTVLESPYSFGYESVDDTFIFRFDAKFLSGDTWISCGDQYIGPCCSAGIFGLRYKNGNIPQIYAFPASPNPGSANLQIVVGGVTYAVNSATQYSTVLSINEQQFYGVQDFVYNSNAGYSYFKRVGPATNPSTASTNGAIFYINSPTVLAGFVAPDITIPSTSFNIDKMDGTGSLPVMNPALGIAGELVFTANGNILLMIVDPRNGSLKPVHRTQVNNTLFYGLSSKLATIINNGSISIRDTQILSYGSTKMQNISKETMSGSNYWPVNPGLNAQYYYLANVFVMNTGVKVKSIEVLTNMSGPLYLLVRSKLFPNVGPTYGGTYVLVVGASNGTYNPNNTETIMSTTVGDFIDIIYRSSDVVNGKAIFDDVQIDLCEALTVAASNNGDKIGKMSYTVTVNYTV